MPYKNIVFAKLEKRLLNDPRWYMLSEKAQLNYIKLILMAAETYNKVPTNVKALRLAFKTNQHETTILKTIEEIKRNFPKFKEDNGFYYFEEFDTKTNYIADREIPGKSQGLPKVGTDKDKEEEEDKDKDIKHEPSVALKEALDKVNKDGLNIYSLINKIKKESKVGAEIPEPVLLRVCGRYWQDKGKIRGGWPWFKAVVIREWQLWEHEDNKKAPVCQVLKDIMAGIGK